MMTRTMAITIALLSVHACAQAPAESASGDGGGFGMADIPDGGPLGPGPGSDDPGSTYEQHTDCFGGAHCSGGVVTRYGYGPYYGSDPNFSCAAGTFTCPGECSDYDLSYREHSDCDEGSAEDCAKYLCAGMGGSTTDVGEPDTCPPDLHWDCFGGAYCNGGVVQMEGNAPHYGCEPSFDCTIASFDCPSGSCAGGYLSEGEYQDCVGITTTECAAKHLCAPPVDDITEPDATSDPADTVSPPDAEVDGGAELDAGAELEVTPVDAPPEADP